MRKRIFFIELGLLLLSIFRLLDAANIRLLLSWGYFIQQIGLFFQQTAARLIAVPSGLMREALRLPSLGGEVALGL
ncbi:MAG: hypothetical protein IJ844_09500, partial [Prevotella sp.]|nr:hypothetical protein [Prevotella sp.]